MRNLLRPAPFVGIGTSILDEGGFSSKDEERSRRKEMIKCQLFPKFA
jgi:hypothetical protein